MFRPASNLAITIIYLFYVAVKCISILLLSWLTTVESKKTGVCIHRCALAADKNEVYELVKNTQHKKYSISFITKRISFSGQPSISEALQSCDQFQCLWLLFIGYGYSVWSKSLSLSLSHLVFIFFVEYFS